MILIEFILFVIISSVILNGWYEVTRKGKLLGFWENFWEHYTQESDLHAAVFKYPHWVRMPLSQCIMCFASVYGTIIFTVTIFIFDQLKSYTLIQIFFIWLAYVLCLTCTNYFIHKKLK